MFDLKKKKKMQKHIFKTLPNIYTNRIKLVILQNFWQIDIKQEREKTALTPQTLGKISYLNYFMPLLSLTILSKIHQNSNLIHLQSCIFQFLNKEKAQFKILMIWLSSGCQYLLLLSFVSISLAFVLMGTRSFHKMSEISSFTVTEWKHWDCRHNNFFCLMGWTWTFHLTVTIVTCSHKKSIKLAVCAEM